MKARSSNNSADNERAEQDILKRIRRKSSPNKVTSLVVVSTVALYPQSTNKKNREGTLYT